ncbi:M16 family metallopeptidase [Chthonobacter albigriseus]|uniref:M16 family metallopeptidase n=1 Tax=Chthonobacter albigriseus TaxID=1683161 RepID=UPI0015EF82B2|nr:insulinase family protein [Chthonobacter albigriseus]
MIRLLLIVLLIAAAPSLSMAGSPQPDGATVGTAKSPAGIAYRWLQRPEATYVALAVAWRGGVLQDPPDQPGLSQIASAALMASPVDDVTVDRIQDMLGDADARLELWPEAATVNATLVAPVADTEWAIRVLAARLFESDLDQSVVDHLARNRAAALREWRASREGAAEVAFFDAVLADRSASYRAALAASADAHPAVTVADIQRWRGRQLVRLKAVVTVVAPFGPDEIGPLVDILLAGRPAGRKPRPIDLPQLRSTIPGLVTLKSAAPGNPFVLVGSPYLDQPALQASRLSALVAGGEASRLDMSLRGEAGRTYGFLSGVKVAGRMGAVIASGHVAPEDLDDTIARINAAWTRLREEGPTPAEIANMKVLMARELNPMRTPSLRLAQRMLAHALEGRPPDTIFDTAAEIDAVDLADRSVRLKLMPERPVVVVVR